MKQPRTKICVLLAVVLFSVGTLLTATGNFYAVKWGGVIGIVGAALALALIIEYGWERLINRTT